MSVIGLNAGQADAVEARAAHVVVSAGAGSGKTRVLVQRFVDRVLERERAGEPSPLRSVLLITFTDKAAGELTERVRRALLEAGRADLAREVDGAWISTIHSFCARIVRRHALELGVDVGFAVLADPRSGLERSESFERAVRACLDDPEEGGEIAGIVEEGVPALRATILSAYDRARSKGVPLGEVAVAGPGDVRRAVTDLARVLDDVLPAYGALNPTTTVADNLVSFAALAEEAAAIGGDVVGRETADAALALGAYRGALRGNEEMKTLTSRVNDAIAEVVQAAVDTVAARRAHAWRTVLVAFADEYERSKARQGVLDFEDLQLLTRRLWAERPDIEERMGSQFAEVMVDEFQDINPLQLQVITPVSRAAQCVVGDVQQSIYRFRDADVGLLEEKRRSAESAPGQRACRLTVNYRSDARLLDGLNRIFGSSDFFGDEYLTLESGATQGESAGWPEGSACIEAMIVDKSLCPDKDWREVEARALASRLSGIVSDGWAKPDDIVVLVRASTTMPVYVDALREAGLDVIAPSSGGFYATPEYADVRALLRVLANPLDDEGLLALLAGGLGGLSDDALLALCRPRSEGGLWGALAQRAGSLPEGDAGRALVVRETIERLRAMRGRVRLADATLHAASVLGPGGGLLERGAAWANVRKIARLATEFESTGAGDPAEFLRHLDDRETFVPREPASGLVAEGSGAVRVMTVHAAKGLEFPVVAVADLGHRPPNRHPAFLLAADGEALLAVSSGPQKADGDKAPRATAWQAAADAEKELDRAEAKRVFYVACTRAERALILAGSVDGPGGGAEGIAAQWVLDAARRGGEELAGLMTVAVLGVEDVPIGPRPVPVPGAAEAPGADAPIPPRLPRPEPIVPPREVSYTALALYERCSYRFFAERMLRVGSLDIPKPEDPMAFGSALHAALELVARGETVDVAALSRLAASHGLPAEAVERLAAAREAVRGSGIEPLIADGRPEMEFAIAVEGGVVRGTMDLVSREGGRAMVLDYKTGLTWDATGARYAAQAEVYALALLESGASAVEVRFVHVEAGCEEAVYSFGTGDRQRIRAGVEAVLARMSAGEFPPLKAYDFVLCADCPVSGGLCRVVHPHTRAKA
jgi:ATP-dependent exoDNAse (exonuclease V) beta subunit